MGLPGIFESTIFSPPRGFVPASVYIKAMHPKTEISPTPNAVEKILQAGWAGQMKVHGHRAQVHLSADAADEPVVYNRQGRPHKMLLPDKIAQELRRIFDLEEEWTVIDAEWIKPQNRLFIFDVLKLNGKLLRALSYKERFDLLPKSYISPFVKTLPLLTTSAACMKVLGSDEDYVEGLVFKAVNTKGFEDTSIIRCRKRR
jgi:ATP-dependent DNA ligase